MTIHGELRLRVTAAPPSALRMAVGDDHFAVRPLVEIELSDAGLQRMIARVRQRLVSSP
jgi:hypothetical protein